MESFDKIIKNSNLHPDLAMSLLDSYYNRDEEINELFTIGIDDSDLNDLTIIGIE